MVGNERLTGNLQGGILVLKDRGCGARGNELCGRIPQDLTAGAPQLTCLYFLGWWVDGKLLDNLVDSR